MHELLWHTEHRPYPPPQREWVMFQRWNDLLFAHWAADPDYVRRFVPRELELDTYDGKAYLGVIPFHMSDVHLRRLPPIRGGDKFAELNVRTYVTLDGRPGVFFFSLDTPNIPAIMGARSIYALPYFHANMSVDVDGGVVRYVARRTDVERANPEFHSNVAPEMELLRTFAEFEGRYWPVAPVRSPKPGSLEHFLTERYCLYSVLRGRVYRAEVHHPPWPLQAARTEIVRNTMAEGDGIRLPDGEPVLHFAKRQDVLVWWPERVR